MRRMLIDLPALLFDLWWTTYTVLLTFAVMAFVTLTLLSLSLEWLFGRRWGW